MVWHGWTNKPEHVKMPPRFYKEILTQASPKFPASLKTKTRISGWVLMVRAYTKSIYQLNMSPITNLPATKTMTGVSTVFRTIGSATYWKIKREWYGSALIKVWPYSILKRTILSIIKSKTISSPGMSFTVYWKVVMERSGLVLPKDWSAWIKTD